MPGKAVLAPLPRKRRRQARSPFVERVRKRRIDVGIPKVAVAPLELVPLQPPVCRKRLRGVSPTVRAAAVGVPGVELLSSGTPQGRDSVTQDVMEAPASAAVARLRAGRTVINLVRLMNQTMFNSLCDESPAGDLPPAKGLFADLEASPVWIVATYLAWRVARADVIPLRRMRNADTWSCHFAEVKRCKQDALTNVGPRYVLKPMKARPTNGLVFLPARSISGLCGDPNREELALLQLAASAWVHRSPEIRSDGPGDGGIGRIGWRPWGLTPIAAQLHMAECLEQGDRHHVAPRQDRKTCNFIF